MKKKLFTLLTLLMAVCSGAWADGTEIIKITITGQKTCSVTGTIGGTGSVNNLGSSSPYKLNSDGAYVAITLATGYFKAGDIVKIDGSKAMQIYTGAPTSGTFLATTAGPTEGVITYELPSTLPASTNGIYIYRSSSTYNGTLTYMSVIRTDDKTALTGEWSNAAPSFGIGDDASGSLPTFTVSGGATITTDYTISYSKISGDDLATFTTEGGITAINTAAEGTETIRATVSLINTEEYSIATETYDCVITVEEPKGTVTWAFTDASSLTSTNSPAEDFLVTRFNYGTNLNASTASNVGSGKWTTPVAKMVYFQPTVTVAKGAAEAAENTLEFVVIPKDGITFTPTKVSFKGCNHGGTGDPQTTAYIIYSDDSQETVFARAAMNRSDKNDYSTATIVDKTLENAVAGAVKLRIWMDGLTNTAKGVAFTDIVITGTVSGTPSAGTTYTITASPNNASYGVVSGGGVYAADETGNLYAAAKTGYVFSKWQKGGADFEGNTLATINIKATADETYTAVFAVQKAITYNANGGTGTVPATGYVLSGEDYVTETPFFLYKAGNTFNGWSDGTNTYAAGATISDVTEDITLTAQWIENTVAPGDAFTTVDWTFVRNDGAPTIESEGGEMDYVQQVTIAGTAYDAIMHINTKKSAGVSDKTGKVNNKSNAAYAQVNEGTVFSIPAVSGMIVRYPANQTAAVNDIGFTDNGTDIASQSLTNANTTANNVLTYQYTGAASTLYLVVKKNIYPYGITVAYPGSGEELISTLSGRNYASYVTSQKMDFASADGITAYIATGLNGTNDAVVLSSVDIVPANTPIIVKTDTKGATVNVPVTTADALSIEGNLLVAGDGTTGWDGTDGYTYYYLASDKFHRASSGTLQLGKAYLKLDSSSLPADGSDAPELAIVFDNEAAGINEVRSEMSDVSGTFYDLQGRKVAQPTKGLYIVNGKKVVIK